MPRRWIVYLIVFSVSSSTERVYWGHYLEPVPLTMR